MENRGVQLERTDILGTVTINKYPFFLRLMSFVMALSGIVTLEPAPVDLGVVILLFFGLLHYRVIFAKSFIPIYMLLFAFLTINTFTLFFAQDLVRATRFMLITFYLIASWFFFVGIVRNYGEAAVKLLFFGYSVAASSTSVISILAYFSLIPWSETFLHYGRASGMFKDPNVFGPFMIPVAIYSISQIENPERKRKFWWVFVLVTTSAALLFSFSRGAWGSYILALASYYVVKFLIFPNFRTVIKAISLLFSIGIVLAFTLLIPNVQTSIENRFAYQEYDDVRFSKQGDAIEVAMSNPVGVGPGQTEIVINYATHNSYLRVWLENGVLGVIIYSGLILTALFRSLKIAIRSKNTIYAVATASILATLLNSFVVDVVHWRHFWLVLAIPWFSHPTLIKRLDSKPVTSKKKRYKIVW